MLSTLVLLSLFAQSFTQLVRNGSCPDLRPQNFDFRRIRGRWNEYARIPNIFEDPYHTCVKSTYYINKDKVPVIHVDTTLQLSGAWYIWEGHLFATAISGVYNLKYPSYAQLDTTSVTFVDGDWENWMISQSCSEVNGQSAQFVWVWTNTTELKEEHRDRVTEVLAKNNLSLSDFKKTLHEKCPSYRPLHKLPV